MHRKGTPEDMQEQPSYENVVMEVSSFFRELKDHLTKHKLPRIWIDPGIGFGKTLEHNLELMRSIDSFLDPSWGVLLGSSRKSWIDRLCLAPDPLERLGGSIASAIDGASKGVEIIRVHDVQATVQALKVAMELASSEQTS